MFSILYRFTAIVLLAASLAPAAAAWCDRTAARCTMPVADEHACCDLPRLTDCTDCGNTDAANEDTEPATRVASATPTLLAADVVVAAVVPADRTFAVADHSSPPRSTSARLSLLSILLV